MSGKNNTNLLTERSLILFKSLVEHFIQDGQPVGSRTLARDSNLDLSPATIRNIMADLEDLGLLSSPHTSAGRVPTIQGYRLFVDNLLRVSKLDQKQVEQIARELDPHQDMKNLMEKTSFALSEVTHLASVITLPRAESRSLQHIEFIALSDNRVLVILVINDQEIQNRIINTARVYTNSELQQATNYLNEKFSGKSLGTIREEIIRELENTKNNVSQLMQATIEMAGRAFEQDGEQEDYVMTGHTNLMDVAELSDVEKLKKLFDSFNHKHDILHLLEQSIQARGVQIFIGEESGYDVLDDCSIVTSPYEIDGRIIGVLGVIGPTRMEYQRVIPIVDITAKMLGSALNSQQ